LVTSVNVPVAVVAIQAVRLTAIGQWPGEVVGLVVGARTLEGSFVVFEIMDDVQIINRSPL